MALSRRFANLGMVAFIDLLGFSARVLKVETEADLKAIEKDVRRVQRWFDFKTRDDDVREVQKLQSKKVLAFSDCLVVATPSFSELAASEGDFDIQLSDIVAMAYAQGLCAINGIFVRGGADYGLWYKRGDTLISPAMVCAVQLEKNAVVPMIAISDDLIKHFQEHPHRSFWLEKPDPVDRYFSEFVLPDGTKRWMIDYLPLALGEMDGSLTAVEKTEYREAGASRREELRNAAWSRAILETISLHKDRIVAAHAAAQSESIKLKYEWLGEYHDGAVHRVIENPPVDLLIGPMG